MGVFQGLNRSFCSILTFEMNTELEKKVVNRRRFLKSLPLNAGYFLCVYTETESDLVSLLSTVLTILVF